MAAVTLGSPSPSRHVWGDQVVRFFVVSGASGSTINTGMVGIVWAENQPFTQAGTASLINGLSVSGGTITLTSSAPMVNEVIQVIATKG